VRHSPSGSSALHQQQRMIGSRHSVTQPGVARPSGARHYEAEAHDTTKQMCGP
jgi:hypothetical protein